MAVTLSRALSDFHRRLIFQRIFDCSLYLHHARQEFYCRKQIRVSHLFSIFCVSADSPWQMGLVFTMKLHCCYKCNPYNRFKFQFAILISILYSP
jgi:hypothetical protein